MRRLTQRLTSGTTDKSVYVTHAEAADKQFKMKVEGKSTRFHERTRLEIPVEVIYNENTERAWREQTRTEEVTICGGGFTLSRPVEPKRLVHLRLPMPKNFRLFDFGKAEYDVWGLVRYVRLMQANRRDGIRLKVGTALVGNNPPRSFLRDPATLYDLKPVLRHESLWDLRELPRQTGRYVRSAEDRRKISVKIILETINDQGQIIESVVADTENISESGMAVKTKLPAGAERYVLVKTINKSLSLLAKVRGAYALGADNNLRLHLEFLSGKWFV